MATETTTGWRLLADGPRLDHEGRGGIDALVWGPKFGLFMASRVGVLPWGAVTGFMASHHGTIEDWGITHFMPASEIDLPIQG